MTAVLEAREVHVARGRAPVLHGVTLSLAAGEALALVGPNAAGKSTLLRTLAGLLPATRGAVLLDARPLPAWPRDALARALALVTSEDEGPGALAVEDRVALGRYPHRGPFRPLLEEDRAAVRRALERTGIAPLARRRLATLSAGERQLATLLLLDEPAAHLDIGHQLRLFRVLDEARAGGVAVLAVVHDLPRAAAWAGRIVLLAGGRIAAEGAPDAVLASEECARAFAVKVRGHAVPGSAHPLYSFEERP